MPGEWALQALQEECQLGEGETELMALGMTVLEAHWCRGLPPLLDLGFRVPGQGG